MKMMYPLCFVVLAGCSSTAFDRKLDGVFGIDRQVIDAAVASAVEVPVVVAPPPPETAVSVEDFDTTTADDRAAAATVVAEDDAPLGTTIASLGSPTEPGIWLKTPLVTTVTMGRIVYEGNAISAELRPSGGTPGSGSEMSLAAMRLIAAPLTGLPEVTVFAAP